VSSRERRLDGFRSGEKHLGLSETVALRGAAAEGDLGRVHARKGSLQPFSSRDAATRVLEGQVRGGELARQGGPFARAPSARAGAEAKAFVSSRGSSLEGSNVGSAPSRERRWKEGLTLPGFADEDRTFEGCARASCRVAEVVRRRLAQRSVSRVLF
jgi:hypothetical protein